MEPTKKDQSSLFITLLICAVLVVLAAVLGYNLGQANPVKVEPQGAVIDVSPTTVAKDLNIDQLDVDVLANLNNGYVRVKIHPNESFVMPSASTIEAFLVDGGTVGSFGVSSEVVQDEFFGKTLSDQTVDALYDQVPYALSIGRIRKVADSTDFIIEFNTQSNLTPYDRIVLTLESDTERTDYDPRPGAIIYEGEFGDNLKTKKAINEALEESNDSVEEE